jgi:hypothetical protein
MSPRFLEGEAHDDTWNQDCYCGWKPLWATVGISEWCAQAHRLVHRQVFKQ